MLIKCDNNIPTNYNDVDKHRKKFSRKIIDNKRKIKQNSNKEILIL